MLENSNRNPKVDMREMPTQTDIFSNDSLSSKSTLHSWAAPSPPATKPASYSSALSTAQQTEGDEEDFVLLKSVTALTQL